MIPSILPSTGPIGVFDSGYGGLTILDKIYNPQIEMFARFKMKSSFHKTKRII